MDLIAAGWRMSSTDVFFAKVPAVNIVVVSTQVIVAFFHRDMRNCKLFHRKGW